MTMLLSAAATVLLIASASAQDMVGHWQRSDGNVRIEIATCGAAFCAVNTWVNSEVKGEKVGDRLVMDVRPAAPDLLTGTAYDPQRHLRLSARIQVYKDRLISVGCVLGGIVCRDIEWTRTP